MKEKTKMTIYLVQVFPIKLIDTNFPGMAVNNIKNVSWSQNSSNTRLCWHILTNFTLSTMYHSCLLNNYFQYVTQIPGVLPAAIITSLMLCYVVHYKQATPSSRHFSLFSFLV